MKKGIGESVLEAAARGKGKMGGEQAINFVFTQLFKMRKELKFDLMGEYPDMEWKEPTVKRKGKKIVMHVELVDADGESGYVEYEITVK